MRNLKKVLSLALALVMLLGMMVVGASAELAYKDADSITKKEAVEVMTALGILSGDETGFRPTGTLKRSEAAKILVFVADGSVVANALGQADTQFSDVPATHWASGFVAYCANLGIISGVDATHFNPDGELTSQEFAKMLLVAMGGEEANYVGSAWATNVRRDAIKAKINENADITLWNKAITREQAAQMALNALTKTLDGGKMRYPVVVEGKDTMYFDTANEAALYAAVIDGAKVDNPVADTSSTLGEKNYGLKQEVTSDKVGNKITKWTANGKVEVIVDKSSDAMLTIAGEDYKKGSVSNTKVTGGSLKGYTEGKDFESWYNGSRIEDSKANEYYTNIGSIRGATIKVYGSGTTMTKVVIEEPYFTVVDSVSKKGDTIKLKVYEAGWICNTTDNNTNAPKTVTIKEGDGDYDLVKDMAKDDVFMGIFQPGWNNARTGENATYGLLVAIAGTPDTFDGMVTAARFKAGEAYDKRSYNDSTVTVDGEVYKFANEYSRTDIKVKSEGTFYTFNGYLYHFVATTPVGPDGYALIVNAIANTDESLDASTINLQARVILSDGTVGVYKIAVDKNSEAGGVKIEGKDWKSNFEGKVFTYTIDDDEMTLGAVKESGEGSVSDVTDYIGGTSKDNILFNSKTVYVVYSGSNKDTTAKVVTGVANLGTIEKAPGKVVLGKNNVANIAFINGAVSPVSSGDYVYVNKGSEGAELVDDKTVITYTGITPEGDEITVYNGTSTLSKSGVYSISEDDEIVGNVFGTNDKPANYKAGAADVKGELIKVGDGTTYYTITEDTNIVAIDGDADVDAFNGDDVMVILDSSNQNIVETIFITKDVPPASGD